jgi:hypothetical protein
MSKKATEVPIFPLPHAVFFPKTALPLHIFEPRYRVMIEDAAKHDKLIAIVLLKDGWEKDYFGAPAVHDIACVGKIQKQEKLSDGKYNIVLYGLQRARIVDFVQEEPYRVARIEYLHDRLFTDEDFDESSVTEEFVELVQKYLEAIGVQNAEDILQLRKNSIESIVNQVASIIDFSSDEKQTLLELDSLEQRCEQVKLLLLDRLRAMRIASRVKFVPKDPSWN